jgi:transcriptional regulator with XRE-family HTH domain
MSLTFPESVAAEVRAQMGRQRISQAKLAEALGRSQPYVYRRLKDDAEYSFDVAELTKIAEVLGVTVAQLLPAEAVAS